MWRPAVHLIAALLLPGFWGQNLAHASDAFPAAAAGISETRTPPKMLVLTNGDLVEGAISVSSTGYELTQPSGGRILLPESVVWFTATTRDEAYKELRKRFPDKTANGHVSIARWCTRYGLKAAADAELRTALTIDPKHREARGLLTLMAEPSNPVPSFVTDVNAQDPEGTLGGLPPHLALEFSQRVQPILVNGCGNASCHGAASNSTFKLQNARSGSASYKAMTQRNLELIRGQISNDDPIHSRIFTAPQESGHGGTRRPIFVGPRGQAQLRTLLAWATAVARSSPNRPADAAEGTALIRLASDTRLASKPGDERGRPEAALDPETGRVTDGRRGDRGVTDVLQEAIAEERADAFDPQEFNRRFGPDAGRPPLPASEGSQQ